MTETHIIEIIRLEFSLPFSLAGGAGGRLDRACKPHHPLGEGRAKGSDGDSMAEVWRSEVGDRKEANNERKRWNQGINVGEGRGGDGT